MRYIDTHVHLGTSKFSGVSTTEEAIMAAMQKYDIKISLVMPQPTLEDVSAVHHSISEMSLKYPGRIYGMIHLDPWLDEQIYMEEVKVCVETYKFVAMKLHPMGHNISPLSPRCEKLYEAARFYKLPVLVHTGLGTPFSLPSLMMDPAARYPDVTFILSHAGFASYSDEAIVTAKYRDNIVLEPSWCPSYIVRKMIDAIGAERIIMGSDHISNLPVELTKYRSIELREDQLEQIFMNNPTRIFNL